MTPEDLVILKTAVEHAMEDVRGVSMADPQEVLPKEEQFRSALFASFRGRGYVTQVEAAYPGTTKEADIRAYLGAGRDLWVEVKRTWDMGTVGWVNKPAEQFRTWQEDVTKLSSAPESSLRVFLLFGVFDSDPATNPRGVAKRIATFYPEQLVMATDCRPLAWRDSGIRVMKAWAWSF